MSEEEEESKPTIFDALYNAAEEDPAPATLEDHLPQGRTLTEALAATPEAEPESESEPEPEPEPAPAPAIGKREVPLAKPTTAPPAVTAPAPAPVPAAPAAPPEAPPPGPTFLPEQIDRLRLAKLAQDLHSRNPNGSPKEYAGMYDRYLEYFTKEAEYVKKNGESDLEWDEEYKAIKEMLDPNISRSIISKLEKEEVKLELRREMSQQATELSRLKRELHTQKATPKVKRNVTNYVKANYENAVPEEIREAITKEGKDKFAESRPYEYDIVKNNLSHANEMVSEFEKINNGLVKYSHDKHNGIVKTIEALGQQHKKVAKAKNGKTFVTRDEFVRLQEAEKANHYTWESSDVKRAISENTKRRIANDLNKVGEKLKKYNGVAVSKPMAASKELAPTPRTATPRTPPPSTPSAPVEEKKTALESMLVG